MTRRTAIILGNGFALRSRWHARSPALGLESRLCALAAAQLIRRGAVERLVLSGGHTAGSTYPSEAAAMATYLRRHVRGDARVVWGVVGIVRGSSKYSSPRAASG